MENDMVRVPKIKIVWPSGNSELVEVDHAYWIHLVNKAYEKPNGLGGLSQEEQTFYHASVFHGEIMNGGFNQFFTNTAGNHYAEVVYSLEKIGADTALEKLLASKNIIFGDDAVSSSQRQRHKIIKRHDKDEQAVADLEKLSRKYYSTETKKIEKLLQAYSKMNELVEKYIEEYKPKLVG